jgi:UDP-sugar transporter A1/2/3
MPGPNLLRRTSTAAGSRSFFFCYVSLFALTLQNTALVLLMKRSMNTGRRQYSAAAAVTVSEMLKLAFCACVALRTEGREPLARAFAQLPTQIHMTLPSILYILQNNLLFQAVHKLPVGVYIVCAQTKILTSAFFSYVLLGTLLDSRKKLSLVLLTFGMVLVQAPASTGSSEILTGSTSDAAVGILSILAASLTSGFAGVYLEKIYKSDSNGCSALLKNMQLACFSVPLSFLVTIVTRNEMMHKDGIFIGFDAFVAAVCFLQAAGGIIVAAVMRHASTIMKCFAISISICLCTAVSFVQGDETLTWYKSCGIALVNFATVYYSIGEKIRSSTVGRMPR